ncbi:MAG: histidine phosphatase family protein [Verrucomicrobiota bacterium]
MNPKKLTLSLLASALTLSVLSADDTSLDEGLSKSELLEQLEEGGLILYIRHATTEKDYADQVSADVNDGSTQRVLSEAGWHEAVHIGNAVRFYNIPVGIVLSSEYFRAWQTAWLAFGEYEKNPDFNFLPFEDYTPEQFAEMKKRVAPYLSAIPADGTNTVIVAHDDPFEAATGIYPEPQGVTFVLKPLGDGYQVLGSIAPDAW